jgi:cellulose synthase/poly-beta-1,6-N-acetylglucosamine synthase-like glycosyltransferase
MDFVIAFWTIIQIIIGYNLIIPFIFFIWWKMLPVKAIVSSEKSFEADYAIIVTAYEQTLMLGSVVTSLLNLEYSNYLIYIVADNCDVSTLKFNSNKVIVLKPEFILASNTKSHAYAVENFQRQHQRLTIIDSDNLVDTAYLKELNKEFDKGFIAVQGYRAPKNLDSTIACLDAARDIYYHFYDGKVLFELGSSATLAGSGMAFTTPVYKAFLNENDVSGAGFDKVLQSWLLINNFRISFTDTAILYDEKTSKSEQLVHQRSRWINTWFKYFTLGLDIFFAGLRGNNRNKLLFGIVLVRPPLFIFLILALLCLFVNLVLGFWISALAWVLGFLLFVFSFWISLNHSKVDGRIYKSLVNIPKFVFYQLLSLLKVRKANKISVATKHYHEGSTGQN